MGGRLLVWYLLWETDIVLILNKYCLDRYLCYKLKISQDSRANVWPLLNDDHFLFIVIRYLSKYVFDPFGQNNNNWMILVTLVLFINHYCIDLNMSFKCRCSFVFTTMFLEKKNKPKRY
ncbi:hypothetical protein L2E82_51703 [Cichorium intybus]|nr:hypothetical protein L2E82_51703 [Cichorium intybus]